MFQEFHKALSSVAEKQNGKILDIENIDVTSSNENNDEDTKDTNGPIDSNGSGNVTCSTNDSSIIANTALDKTSTVKKGKQIKKPNFRAVKRTAQPENAMDSTRDSTSSNTAARCISTAPPEKVSRTRTTKSKTIGAVGPADVSEGPSTQKSDF